jgi:hypothetical protein
MQMLYCILSKQTFEVPTGMEGLTKLRLIVASLVNNSNLQQCLDFLLPKFATYFIFMTIVLVFHAML